MSLYTPSTGILETHVTWEDVEEAMQKALGTEAVFGMNKKATNIGDLKGFMSRIALIDADWQGIEEGRELPEKFAVKICSQLAHVNLAKIMGEASYSEEKLESMSSLTRLCHDQEVKAYKLLIKFEHPDIPYTKVYHLKPFTSLTDLKGFMIFDYVPNVYSMGMHQPIPANDLKQLVRGIATFSALGQTLSVEEKEQFGGPEFMEIGMAEFFNDEQLAKQFQGLRVIFDGSELVEKVISIFWTYVKMIKKYMRIESYGFNLVLNHCDLWQANMLHSLGEDGNFKLEAIIDWQGVSRMPAGMDMARVMLGCLSAKDRRDHADELLSLYHETFTNVHGSELFTLEQLTDAYNLFFPKTAMLIAPLILSFLDAQKDLDDKEKYRKESVDRLVAILEDVVKVHEINLEKFPEFMKI